MTNEQTLSKQYSTLSSFIVLPQNTTECWFDLSFACLRNVISAGTTESCLMLTVGSLLCLMLEIVQISL